MEATARILQDIRDLGVTIALDDFGTGYSSLTMLRDLPADVVKIDKSFIDKIADETSTDSVLARLVIETAHSLGMGSAPRGGDQRAGRAPGRHGLRHPAGWLIPNRCPAPTPSPPGCPPPCCRSAWPRA